MSAITEATADVATSEVPRLAKSSFSRIPRLRALLKLPAAEIDLILGLYLQHGWRQYSTPLAATPTELSIWSGRSESSIKAIRKRWQSDPCPWVSVTGTQRDRHYRCAMPAEGETFGRIPLVALHGSPASRRIMAAVVTFSPGDLAAFSEVGQTKLAKRARIRRADLRVHLDELVAMGALSLTVPTARKPDGKRLCSRYRPIYRTDVSSHGGAINIKRAISGPDWTTEEEEPNLSCVNGTYPQKAEWSNWEPVPYKKCFGNDAVEETPPLPPKNEAKPGPLASALIGGLIQSEQLWSTELEYPTSTKSDAFNLRKIEGLLLDLLDMGQSVAETVAEIDSETWEYSLPDEILSTYGLLSRRLEDVYDERKHEQWCRAQNTSVGEPTSVGDTTGRENRGPFDSEPFGEPTSVGIKDAF